MRSAWSPVGRRRYRQAASDLLTRIMGSRAFAAVARVVPYCADKEPGHFVFGQEKNSLEPNVPFALGYHFTKLAVGYDEKAQRRHGEPTGVGRPEIDSVERIVLDKEGGTSEGRDAGGHVAQAGSRRV